MDIQFNCLFLLVTSILLIHHTISKRHGLTFVNEARRNILISQFGYGDNATLDFSLANFSVPKVILEKTEVGTHQNKLGSIGFTLSKSNRISDEVRTNPHICQLEQQDQGLDAFFFVFDFAVNTLHVVRSGEVHDIILCKDIHNCPYVEEGETRNSTSISKFKTGGFLANLFGSFNKDVKTPYLDYIPLTKSDGQYSTQFGIRFNAHQTGYYYLYYHNCFNYREHGYSDRVAVDFTVEINERNFASYLSVGDIPKPAVYIYMAFLFALATILWANLLCKSDSRAIYKVHRLMLILVFLKTLSLLFHGINYYFVSIYGRQQELWAIIYYVTHLFKGALLFGTIILIGTGYTFFKNFLTDRDRHLFMFVLPIQILDNVAMIIIEESKFYDQRYSFWLEVFIFLDLVCCMAVIWPIIWSIHHLQEAAKTDGKIAFSLEKLRLFRQFYVIVIAYIYVTRVAKLLFEFLLPQEHGWIAELIVELAALFFYCLVGSKFRPVRSNPYLRLTQDDVAHDAESGIALTTNGIYEKLRRKRQTTLQDEIMMEDPLANTDEEENDDDTLLPKTGRDMGLLTL